MRKHFFLDLYKELRFQMEIERDDDKRNEIMKAYIIAISASSFLIGVLFGIIIII